MLKTNVKAIRKNTGFEDFNKIFHEIFEIFTTTAKTPSHKKICIKFSAGKIHEITIKRENNLARGSNL